jgi:nucleoside-diphosphate-sugar epimerase
VKLCVDGAGAAIPCRLELSRTRQLRNSIRVECERAVLELHRSDFTSVEIHNRGVQARNGTSSVAHRVLHTARWQGCGELNGYQAFRAEIDDWVDAIVSGAQPVLSAKSVMPVVRIIDECYRHKKTLKEPWDNGPSDRRGRGPAMATTVQPIPTRVLVTGAGGFLGCRTVDLLANHHGVQVRALVRQPRSAARLARWPIDIAIGDVCSAADMSRVMDGCDAVVHCAVGTSWKASESARTTVEGTRRVAEAALNATVKRFVHISTMAVHGDITAPLLTEDSPTTPAAGDRYGWNKLRAEQEIAALVKRGLPAVVLRPTRIYGPFSETFTVRPLQALMNGRLVLAGDVDVPANMVYVDNVVDAIARALVAAEPAIGHAYLINDDDQVSLREFFGFFADAHGLTLRVEQDRIATAPRPAALLVRAIHGLKTIAFSAELRGLVRRVMDTDPIGSVPRALWDASPRLQRQLLRSFHVNPAVVHRPAPLDTEPDLVYSVGRARVVADSARSALGYESVVDRRRAMALTLAWAEHARILAPRV